MQRQGHSPHEPHVLYENGIAPGLAQTFGQCQGVGQLAVVDNGVKRHVHTGTKNVGIATQGGYVLYRVAGSRTGPEARRADIYGIGPAVDGGDTTF